MNPTLKFLLTSRRVWLAVFAVVQSLVLHYLHVPDDVWVTIAALCGALIAAFTVDDHAATLAGVHNITGKSLREPVDDDFDIYESACADINPDDDDHDIDEAARAVVNKMTAKTNLPY